MKKFFIGIDVSKETVDVSCLDQSRMNAPEYIGVYRNRPSGYRSMVKDLRSRCGGISMGQWLFCCETTGVYDHNLCKWLCTNGLFIWRENALQIKKSLGVRRGKDDKSDSMAIADYAARHNDKAARYELPSPQLQALKDLYAYRRTLVTSRAAVKARLSSAKVEADGPASSFIVKDLKRQIKTLDDSIKRCEAEMRKVIDSDELMSENFRFITSIKGVGLVCAAAMIIFSRNFGQGATANKLACFAGCASFWETSGTSVERRADVRNYSNRDLKGVLSMAASTAIRYDRTLNEYALRLRAKGKPEAIVKNNVRNKLIHIAFALVRSRCPYDSEHVYQRNETAKN